MVIRFLSSILINQQIKGHEDLKLNRVWQLEFECTLHLQGHSSEAVRALSSMVHRHPGHPTLWLAVALLLLHLYPECKPKAAARCAQVAMALGRSTIDVSKVILHQLMNILIPVQAIGSLLAKQGLNISVLMLIFKCTWPFLFIKVCIITVKDLGQFGGMWYLLTAVSCEPYVILMCLLMQRTTIILNYHFKNIIGTLNNST